MRQPKPMGGLTDIRIGTAGWSIPRAAAFRFDSAGTHLERYARLLRCAEINSSFYRPHAPSTYARWRDSTPADFRFAVKMPRTITHELQLKDAREPFAAFLAQTDALAEKRGPVLVQLAPSLSFDASVATAFFAVVRTIYSGPLVCEPRHGTWFTPAVTSLLDGYEVSRVAADPPPVPGADVPAGWPRIAYFRLHGSPRKYWSRYECSYIASLAAAIRSMPDAAEVWCVFDNTASGAAIENAWELRERLTVDSALQAHGERSMPFKSQAQRRKFAELLVAGKISNETFEEWNRETGGKKLPERAAKARTIKKAKSPRPSRAAKKR
jgi:uncharacterized protein YecE (DUF72 family)